MTPEKRELEMGAKYCELRENTLAHSTMMQGAAKMLCLPANFDKRLSALTPEVRARGARRATCGARAGGARAGGAWAGGAACSAHGVRQASFSLVFLPPSFAGYCRNHHQRVLQARQELRGCNLRGRRRADR